MGSSARVALSAALAVPVAIALFLIMFKLIDRDYRAGRSQKPAKSLISSCLTRPSKPI